jgi:hypothetical protein
MSFDIFAFGNILFNIFAFGNILFDIFAFGNFDFDIDLQRQRCKNVQRHEQRSAF